MGVRFKTFGQPGGITAAVFNDSFNRANSKLTTNTPWRMWCTQSTFRNNNALSAPASLQGVAVVGNQLIVSTAGAAGITFQVRTFFTPAIFWGPLLDGKKQFSEYQIFNSNSAGGANIIRVGPALMCQQDDPGFPGKGGGYILQINDNLGTIALYRGLGSGGFAADTLIIPGGGPMVFVNGDILRLECTPSVPSNSIVVKRNGIQVGAIVDVDGGRPLTGFPGIAFIYQSSNAYFQTIENYSGGPL